MIPTPDGVLLVDKAEGMTSHDVVALVRRKLEIKKVGHCGTLDPLATGLLLLTLGRGTKIQDLLMSEDKEYAGTMTLGITTNTQDRDGEAIDQRPVPSLEKEQVVAAFDKFRGDFYQMPPMVSAIKRDGVPLYKLARQGKVPELQDRTDEELFNARTQLLGTPGLFEKSRFGSRPSTALLKTEEGSLDSPQPHR